MKERLVALATGALLAAAPAGAAGAPQKTPELLERGRASFERNCSACHGDKGAGDGIAAAALNPRPRNFATERFKNGSRPAQIFETLKKGVPGSAMVPFTNLPEEERWALAYWVAELKGPGEAKKK
jgi:mono/diheme cytochrome c family protein